MLRMLRVMVHAAFAGLSLVATVRAQTASEPWRDVYACGRSAGQSFYFGGTGWTPDGIANGVIVLRKRNDEFDLHIGDATGAAFSARADGAVVFGRQQDSVTQVVAIYPTMTVETFLFSAPVRGKVTLAWTSSKRAGIADRVSTFVSECITR